MPIFGDDDPASIEDDYLEQVIPREGQDLWDRSIEESPTWDSMSPEQHMQAADLFAEAAYSGSLDSAENFLDFIDIEWDADDISDYWDLYDQLAG